MLQLGVNHQHQNVKAKKHNAWYLLDEYININGHPQLFDFDFDLDPFLTLLTRSGSLEVGGEYTEISLDVDLAFRRK